MSTTIEIQPISLVHPTVTSITVEQSSESQTPSTQPRPSRQTQVLNSLHVQYTRAMEQIRTYTSGCWLKLQGLVSAVQGKCALQYTRASEKLRTWLLKCWPKLKSSTSTIRRKCTPSTWLAIMITLIIGGVSLRYAYVSIRLAEWTARKDFHELCQSLEVS